MMCPHGEPLAGCSDNYPDDLHPYNPHQFDTWCRTCNSAPGEIPHTDLDPTDYQRCTGGCREFLEKAIAFTISGQDGYWCESCYLNIIKGKTMVTEKPCQNPECWCQKDKVEPYPKTTIDWDKYGYMNIKDTPLGGFDKDKPKTIFEDKSDTKTSLAAFFYDKNTPSWDESPFPGETRETDPETGGMKGKKQAELGAIDPRALEELARVAGYGSQKYSRLNYMKGYKWSLSFDAMMRHLLAFWNGESIDEESNLHHLAHAAWHCMTLMSYDGRDLGTDDRYEGNDWYI